MAQLVRASPCHGEGRRFESDLGRLYALGVQWDLSSAGRASALQAEGHRFEPYRSHSLCIAHGYCGVRDRDSRYMAYIR